MKKLLKIGSVLMFLLSATVFAKNPVKCTKIDVHLTMRNGRESIVSQEEYNLADEFTKRIINYIDASVLALNVLDTDVEAILSVSKNKNNNFSNSIVICRSENDLSVPQEVYRASCTVCGLRSAYSFLKKMQKDNSLSDEFDVHVKRVGDCVQISW